MSVQRKVYGKASETTTAQIKKICDKRHPKLCRRYVREGSSIFGKRCDYLHKEKKMLPDQNSLKERVEELEKVVREKSSEENKMQYEI